MLNLYMIAIFQLDLLFFKCMDLMFPVMSVCCLFGKEENKVAERNNFRTACLPFALSFQTLKLVEDSRRLLPTEFDV